MLPRTSFVGRAREADVVDSQVRAGPLVTLTGAGGIGKTRLALEVAEGLRADAFDGIFVIDLVPLPPGSSVATVEERFLAGLGSPTIETALEWAATATALLVVDNCEHVAEAVAGVIERFLARGTELRILATSRLPLSVPGEHIVVVEPLAADDAVELLRERATSAGAHLTSVDDDLDRLCRRLDGLPLAVELAATRLRSLSPAEVEHGLATSGQLLRQNRRTHGRHLGMDEAIAWSYELLEPDLQQLFRRLAVFPGRFGLDDVIAVVSDVETGRLDLADRLDRLVAHSLVVVGAGRRRYRLLVPVRQLALEWLVDAGEFELLEGRMIDRLVELANEITLRGLEGAWTEDVMDAVFDIAPDLRAAARRCVAIDPDPARAFALFIPNWAVVHHRDVTAVAQLGDELLDRWPTAGAVFWPEMVAIAATAQLGLGELERARSLANETIDADGRTPVAGVVADRVLALVAAVEGDFEMACEHAARGSALAGSAGLDAFRVELDSHRGGFLTQLGDRSQAEAVLHHALEESATAGSLLVELATLQLLAEHHLDDPARCRAYLAAIDERLEPDSSVDTSWSRRITAGRLATEMGDIAGAARAFDDALRLARAAGDRRDAWRAVRGIGIAAALGGVELESAARVLAAVDAASNAPFCGGFEQHRLSAARAAVADLDVLPAAHPVEAALTLAAALDVPRSSVGQHAEDLASAPPSFTIGAETTRVTWAGESVNLRPMKGLADLAKLLVAPGREIHVLELMESVIDEPSTGPLIDAAARRDYEDRLRELQTEIHEAEDDNDLGRLSRAQDEFDAVVAALGEGLGLGGRDRRPGASAEKARQAVAWRVRAAIKRIESELPSCGRHLRNSVKTGAFCRYEPDTDPGWVVSD